MSRYSLKSWFLFIAIFCFTTSYAQDDSYKNELGFDVTPLVQNVLSLNNHPLPNGEPQPYYLIYRRHIEKWALRAGIGGSYWSESVLENDTTTSMSMSSSLAYRLGIEHRSVLSERWQAYYGLDFRLKKGTTETADINSSGVETNSVLTEDRKSGVAPFIGFRFQISDRLFFTTETSLFYYAYESKVSRFYENSSLNTVENLKGVKTEFYPPTSLFFTFTF